MLVSLVDLPPDGTISTAVVVVGAGPAGITVARSLARAGLDVVLLDAGPDPAGGAPDLFAAEMLGAPYPADITRLSGLGGTSGHWTGVCRPLDPDDFEARGWIPDSSWPIVQGDLEPYAGEAHDILELGPVDFSPATWTGGARTPVPAEAPDLADVVFQYSPPTRFAERFRAELAASDRIRVVLGALVVGVRMTPESDRCLGVRVVGEDGLVRFVDARATVLAAGGIETARLLLASDDIRSAGVGNDNDLVGRYFMEHPILWHVPMILARPVTALGFYGLHDDGPERSTGGPTRWRGHLSLPRRLREELGLLGSYAAVSAPGLPGLEVLPDPETVPAATGLVLGVLGEVDPRASAVDLAARVGTFSLVLEQAPNPASRVTIDPERRDRFGLPAVRLDWRFNDLDHHTAATSLRAYGRALGRSGIGRLLVEPFDDLLAACGPASHHMGTVRMASTPSTGVVDGAGRVFGTGNLWVAGSSTFPTGGYANPTLTIVTLALRLADRLASEVSR